MTSERLFIDAGGFTKNSSKILLLYFFGCFFGLSLEGCSGSLPKKTQNTKETITHVNLFAVQFTRPEAPATQMDEIDLIKKETGLPECVSPSELWRPLLTKGSVEELIGCLNTLQHPIQFEFIPAPKPYLILKDGNGDACLSQKLSLIPMPREVFFLGLKPENHKQEMFASSFKTYKEDSAKSNSLTIEIHFPISRKLFNGNDLNLWLTSVVFTLLEDEEEGLIAAPVPESFFRSCFKKDSLFNDKLKESLPPAFWP